MITLLKNLKLMKMKSTSDISETFCLTEPEGYSMSSRAAVSHLFHQINQLFLFSELGPSFSHFNHYFIIHLHKLTI